MSFYLNRIINVLYDNNDNDPGMLKATKKFINVQVKLI